MSVTELPFVGRRRAWAERNGYRESLAPACPHVLMHGRCGVMHCDIQEFGRPLFLDHSQIWRHRDGRPFILAHNYDWDFDKEVEADAWAAQYELSWGAFGYVDGWYHPQAMPVRFWYEKDWMFRFPRHLTPAAIERRGGRWVDVTRLSRVSPSSGIFA